MTHTSKERLVFTNAFFLLLVLASIFQDSLALAELIDGPANLRDKPGGRIIVSLNDAVEIEIQPPYILDKGWYPVGFVAHVEKAAYIASTAEVKGSYNLYDKQGRVIGKTLDAFKIWGLEESNGRIGVVIRDIYTHKTNIRVNGIPEYELVHLLDGPKSAIYKIELQKLFAKYKFEKWPILKDKELEVYFIYESWISDPSPMPRLQLIFYNDRLVSIIHRNLLVSKKYQSRDLFRDMKRMDVAKLDAGVSKRIDEGIVEPLQTAD